MVIYMEMEILKDVENIQPEECHLRNCGSQLDMYQDAVFKWKRQTFSSKTTFFQMLKLSAKGEPLKVVRDKQADVPGFKTLTACSELSNHITVEWSQVAEDGTTDSGVGDEQEDSFNERINLWESSTTNNDHSAPMFRNIKTSNILAFSDCDVCADVPKCSDSLSDDNFLNSSYPLLGSSFVEQYGTKSGRSTLIKSRNSDLFTLDLCSLVGQQTLRYRATVPHFDQEDDFVSGMPYEIYCKWPVIDDSVRWLRPRLDPYPVTFKSDICSDSYAHVYKFTRSEQIEFFHRIDHWLSCRSKKLLQQMKSCSVQISCLTARVVAKFLRQPVIRLTPLSKHTINKWTKERGTICKCRNVIGRVQRLKLKSVKKRASCVMSRNISNSKLKKVPRYLKKNPTFAGVKCTSVLLSHCALKSENSHPKLSSSSDQFTGHSCQSTVANLPSITSESSNDCISSTELCRIINKVERLKLKSASCVLNRIPLRDASFGLSLSSHYKKSKILGEKDISFYMQTGKLCLGIFSDLQKHSVVKKSKYSEKAKRKNGLLKMKINRCSVDLTDCIGNVSSVFKFGNHQVLPSKQCIRHLNQAKTKVKENCCTSKDRKSTLLTKSKANTDNSSVLIMSNSERRI